MSRDTRARRRKTQLPRSLWTSLGPIPVTVVPKIEGEPADGWILGQFSAKDRTIQIRAEMHPRQMLATLGHEWVHAILWDAGLTKILNADTEEAICNAIGGALAAAGTFGPAPRRQT